MKKLLALILLLIFTCNLEFEVKAAVSRPVVSADGAILLDATTGKILYSKNIDQAYPPASTTKIMTALLALENCNMEDKVTVGDKPPKTEGNNIALFNGEEFALQDMLYALINESANDCANAIAEHIGGSVEGFAEQMNIRAREIGCKNTNFINPSGLYNKNHKSSARDLALIMKELVKYDIFRNIATTYSYSIQATNKTPRERNIFNHNKLVVKNSGYYYENCEGGKTGYTIQSKHSYVASAMKDGHRLIVALVHDGKKTFYKDSVSLFNYGFSNFKLEKIYSRGEPVKNVGDGSQLNLEIGEDFYYVMSKDENENASLNFNSDVSNINELKKGQQVTVANVIIRGDRIGSIPILSSMDYKFNTEKNNSSKVINYISSSDNLLSKRNENLLYEYIIYMTYMSIPLFIILGIVNTKR